MIDMKHKKTKETREEITSHLQATYEGKVAF